MELDITHMVNDDIDEMPLLSGSAFELGDNVGQITWRNSIAYAEKHPLLTDEQIEEARDYFKDFGAWSDEERAAWSREEVQALVVQFVAGDIREMEAYESYEDYQKAIYEGQASGNIYQGENDGRKGRWYYSLCR